MTIQKELCMLQNQKLKKKTLITYIENWESGVMQKRSWNWMVKAAMKVWDLWKHNPILRFGDEKGTSIWVSLSLSALSFSVLLHLPPFVSFTVEEMRDPLFSLRKFLFFFKFFWVLRKPHNEKDGFCFTHPSFQNLLLHFLSLDTPCLNREEREKHYQTLLPLWVCEF